MRKIYFALVLAAAVSACAAQQPNARGDDRPAPVERQMPMRDMPGMQDRMLEMRALMERIHETSDPGERERLMSEHMRAMQGAMTMMANMMGAGSAAPPDEPVASAPDAAGAENHEVHH